MRETIFRIGEVAAQAGVNIRTLRFYEREGVLAAAERGPSGYRIYTAETVSVVRFIKRAQALGFTLREVKELLALRQSNGAPCGEVQRNAASKLADVKDRIAQLQAISRARSTLLATCAQPHHAHVCPLLEALDAPLPLNPCPTPRARLRDGYARRRPDEGGAKDVATRFRALPGGRRHLGPSGASLCCAGPLVAGALGLGAAVGLFTRLGPLRPLFVVLAIALLVHAFVRAYRRPPAATGDVPGAPSPRAVVGERGAVRGAARTPPVAAAWGK